MSWSFNHLRASSIWLLILGSLSTVFGGLPPRGAKTSVEGIIKTLQGGRKSGGTPGFYLPESKLIYCAVPKAGSTKLKQWLYCMQRDTKICDLSQKFSYYHHPNNFNTEQIVPLNTLNHIKLSELLFDDSIYKFTVVRNPYQRTLSAYLMFSKSNRPMRMIPDKRNDQVEFSEFLRSLNSTSAIKSTWNQHWREQTDLCSLDFFEYFHLEDFEHSFFDFHRLDQTFQRDTRKLLIDMFGRSDNHHFNAVGRMSEFFTCEDAKLASEIHEKDFIFLNYSSRLFLDSLCSDSSTN